MPRSDRHNEIELNLLESGRLVYLLGGRRVEVQAGHLTAFWACVPHQILLYEGMSEYFVMTIPLTWFLQWRLPEELMQPILQGRIVVEPDEGRASVDRALFAAWSEDVRAMSEGRSQACLLEVQARLRRLALNLAHIDPQHPRRKPCSVPEQDLTYAESMASFIAQHYTQPLTAEDIGRHVGLHPNYAMKLFHETFGTTLNKYVTEHRLSHAQRLLVTTQDQIIEIASEAGFGSLSRFNEAFREAFGCTPREFRRSNASDYGKIKA